MTELDLAHAITSRGLHLVEVYFASVNRVGTNLVAIWQTRNGMVARGGPYYSRSQILTLTSPSVVRDAEDWSGGIAVYSDVKVYWMTKLQSGMMNWFESPDRAFALEATEQLAYAARFAGAAPWVPR